MAGYYQARQGDHLSRIAANFGFSGYRSIWDHPNNADLKKTRQTPHILLPGDNLFIPDREVRVETRSTDQRHRFLYPGTPLMLIIVLKDNDYQPLANADCELRVESDSGKLTTNGSGLLQKPIKSQDANGGVVINQTEMEFRIGDLDPIDSITGQQARLNNLGYSAGRVGAKVDPEQMRSAVEEFQCDQHLTVDGICSPGTQARLKATHGC